MDFDFCFSIKPNSTNYNCKRKRENYYIHFHMIFLDGVYIDGAPESRARFRWVKGRKAQAPAETPEQTPAEYWVSMTWAKRLKRVFKIDLETCSECGGAVKVIACIEDPIVIKKILAHPDKIIPLTEAACLLESRVPPQAELIE